MTRQRVAEHGPSRKYFTQIPNMLDDSELDPFARTLYMHYLRISWQRDSCEETVRETAGHCHMSLASVIKARATLVHEGWIAVEDAGTHGRGALLRIHLLDRWVENMVLYDKQTTEPGNVRHTNNSVAAPSECSPGEQNVQEANNSAINVRQANELFHHANNSNSHPLLEDVKYRDVIRSEYSAPAGANGHSKVPDERCELCERPIAHGEPVIRLGDGSRACFACARQPGEPHKRAGPVAVGSSLGPGRRQRVAAGDLDPRARRETQR